MNKKTIITKLIPILIGIEVILFSDTLQKFGFGMIVGALFVEILNLRTDKSDSKIKNKVYLSLDSKDMKVIKDSISYNQEIKEFIEGLRSEFSDLTSSTYYKDSARLALNQLVRLIDKFEKFKNILDIKLDKDEITYERFMSVTEEVYYNILDNLEQVKDIYQSIEDINIGYIDSRIKALEGKDNLAKEIEEELISLKKRKNMIIKELNSVDRYISINEKAITDIDTMKIKLGRLKCSSHQDKKEFDVSLANLRKVAERINEYSV